jgi:hypothetical protein
MPVLIEDAIADIKDATELPATPKWHLCSAAGDNDALPSLNIKDAITDH